MIDSIDRKIISILQKNSRTSNAEAARKVGLTPTAVVDRIKKLEKKGVLLSYTAMVSPAALGQDLLSFIFVTLRPQKLAWETGQALSRIPGITEVHQLVGEECIMCKAHTAGTAGLESALQAMHEIPAVHATRTVIAFKTVCETPGVLIDTLEKENPDA